MQLSVFFVGAAEGLDLGFHFFVERLDFAGLLLAQVLAHSVEQLLDALFVHELIIGFNCG